MDKALLIKEKAKRELEKRYQAERESLYRYLQTVREKEKKQTLDHNRHLQLICEKLEKVERGEIKRLMINIPPRSLKTEIVSISFPVRCLGRNNKKKFMEISYSAELAQKNSGHARALYDSQTNKFIFPRNNELREDQNTKQHWENVKGGQYYASGSDGTITGVGADIILIDDPLKPGDAMSDTVRQKVNNNFHDTIESRLNSKTDGAIVIIMQRLHDDDLCGHLIELEELGIGEKREKLVIPAISEEDEPYRKQGESFFEKRFPLSILEGMKMQDRAVFSCQYQQNPVNKDTQEFHEEWYRYHGTVNLPTPSNLRIFTTCDPAFKQNQENDNSAIITAGFVEDRMYILEYSLGKWTADVLLDKIMYHIKKWSPEKVGIEAFQAQTMIVTFLKNELQKRSMYVNIEEIKQTGDKLTKIRSLIPYYRSGLIYHKQGMDELENEQKRFPRGKHDDLVDAQQMLYYLYELQPNSIKAKMDIRMDWDHMGRPVQQSFYSNDWLND